MMHYNIDLSIIIGSRNTKHLLKKNISSLLRLKTKVNFEIIVVDDCSSDDSVQMVKNLFPQVTIIKNIYNLGYSKSYNIGTKKACGRYVLHLNSDIFFPIDRSIDNVILYMDKHPKVGILGCKLIKPDGKLDLPCKRAFPTVINIFFQTIGLAFLFPKNKLFGSYYLTFLNDNKIHEIDCVMGAFMLIRKKTIENVGLLDEQFFIYGEDIDYCYRVKKKGWKIIYYPYLKIQHHHGASTKKTKVYHIWLFHLAMILYFKKHLFKKYPFFLGYIVYFAILCRFIFCVLINFFKD